MRAALILILTLMTAAALPAPAAAGFGRTFGLTRAHPPAMISSTSPPRAFKPFRGKHLSSRRGGLDAYPHPHRSKIRFG